MKLFLVALTSLFQFSQMALATDSFEVIKDGKTFVCREKAQQPPPDNGNGAAECARLAYSGPFSRDESIQLCSGARDNAPAECGVDAYRGPFTKIESIQLCKGTWNYYQPSLCATAAYRGPFNKDESVRLCARTGTLATAECAIKAYQGPYSKEEAIQLCKTNPNLILRTLNLVSTIQK